MRPARATMAEQSLGPMFIVCFSPPAQESKPGQDRRRVSLQRVSVVSHAVVSPPDVYGIGAPHHRKTTRRVRLHRMTGALSDDARARGTLRSLLPRRTRRLLLGIFLVSVAAFLASASGQFRSIDDENLF